MRGQEKKASCRGVDRQSGRPRRAPLFFFFVMIILSATILILIARRPAGNAIVVMTKETQAETEGTRSTSLYLFPVHVDGAVVRPGLYYFGQDAILGDAIAKAGGFSPLADGSAVNLAMLLQPHMKIYVPCEGEESGWLPLDGSLPGAEARVDLNRASCSELETLPGVGEATAKAIIAFREENGPFQDIEELMLVPGIKQGRFSKLKDRIRVTTP